MLLRKARCWTCHILPRYPRTDMAGLGPAYEATAAFVAEIKVVTEEWCESLELELVFWILDSAPITTDSICDVHNICTVKE